MHQVRVATALCAAVFAVNGWAAQTIDCGTIVIGAGGAGMRAAIELKEAGKNVCLVEKMPFVGGSTNLAATYFTVINTREQQAAGKGYSLDDYIAMQKKRDPNVSEERLRELHMSGQEALDWLNALGTDITRPLSGYQIATRDGRSLGATIVKAMSKKLSDVGVKPILNTTVTKLNMEGGKVVGATAKDRAGNEVVLKGNNVIIATGGYASSPEAVAKYAPQWKGASSTSAKGSTGDMLSIVDGIGGKLSYMDVVRMNPSVHTDKDGVSSSLSAARAEGGIMVNWDGKRFCNDYYPDYTTLSKWIQNQPKGESWVLIDDRSMKKSKRLQGFHARGYFKQADTIEQLAREMGVPVDNLVATVEKYRTAVKNQKDEEFGRKFNLSIDFTQPPFYAVLTKPGIQVTLGGIEVDKNLQVVDKSGKPIHGLYAVGEVAHDGLFGLGPTVTNIVFGKKVARQVIGK